MRARIESWWLRATPVQRALAAGIPALVIALGAGGIIYASVATGGEAKQVIAPTPTRAATATKVKPTSTVEPTATATAEPVSAGLQGGDYSGGGGGGAPAPSGGAPLRPGAAQTGPGPITGTDMTLSIPKIGVNATVSGRTVGTNGQMGDPSGAWSVIWYDFSPSYLGVGGRPGEPNANVVMAGHVDYINVGPAVFYSIRNLVAGDMITVYSSTGTYNYRVEWSQWASPSVDFSSYVAQQGTGTITLVTCIGGFSAGHYSDRLVVRGVLV